MTDFSKHSSNILNNNMPDHVLQCYPLNLRFVSDGTVAIFMAMLFFIIPSQLPRCGGYGQNEEGKMFVLSIKLTKLNA